MRWRWSWETLFFCREIVMAESLSEMIIFLWLWQPKRSKIEVLTAKKVPETFTNLNFVCSLIALNSLIKSTIFYNFVVLSMKMERHVIADLQQCSEKLMEK